MTPLRTYYRGHNLAVMRDGQANANRYYHFDQLGTTQCLTDAAATVTDRFGSDAWGVQVRRTGTGINRHWYVGLSGYYRSVDRMLEYVRGRSYRPSIGVWISVDPRLQISSLRFG